MAPVRQKQQLRDYMKRLRSALPEEDHARKSGQICEKVWSEFVVKMFQRGTHSPAIAAYMPFRSEVDVRPLIRQCWEHGCRVAVPRAVLKARQLVWHLIDSEEDLETGAYGIREPKPEQPGWNHPEQFDLIVVPGLAFDPKLRRLGYGGGYYDRLFAQLPEDSGRPLTVAVAFDFQIVPEVPAEAHDIRLDAIVTEQRVLPREPVANGREEEEAAASVTVAEPRISQDA